MECCGHLGRWRVLEKVDDLDLDAGLVAVQDLLHRALHLLLDRLPIGCQDGLDITLADHLAHDALGNRSDGAFRILDIEGVVLWPRRVHLPLHAEVDVDDVVVAGEHQSFIAWSGVTGRDARSGHADFHGVRA